MSTSEWKIARAELRSHLFHCHGEITPSRLPFPLKTTEELEVLHENLHWENYMCPPHSHEEDGSITLEYGESFLRDLSEVIKET